MARGNTGLDSHEYDIHLASKSKSSSSARQELVQRKIQRKHAHDSSGVGWHFGLGDKPVKVSSKEEFKQELNKRGLMLATDVKKDLK